MDSLTQIVLGAACGEIALGKKIGNKALVFGAIGGTIPDLDLFFSKLFYSNTIDQLVFHRGFMHSIPFAIIGAFLFGYITYKGYNSGVRKDTTTVKDWVWLYFLSLGTHPILDCFTAYGTQLFLPFSDYKIAFNTIAVVDPLYTLPFLFCLIVVLFYNRHSSKRTSWLKIGFLSSSIYLAFTVANKFYVDAVFESSFQKAKINYHRFTAQPSIFNNILWYGIAETETDYKVGYFSILDNQAQVKEFISVPKNHEILKMSHSDLKKLRNFSCDYYSLNTTEDGVIQYYDMRYPIIENDTTVNSVFGFHLYQNEDRWEYKDDIDRFKNTSLSEIIESIWDRMKGK